MSGSTTVVASRRPALRLPAGLGFVVPLLVVMVIAFNLPMLGMLGRSVAAPAFTLDHYAEFAHSTLYLKVLFNTFEIALVATIACALLGYPLAYWLRGLSPAAQLGALALIVIPFWVSVLIRTYAWIILLGNAGIVNTTLRTLGLIDTPVSFLYNRVGVTIGIVNVLLPFLVLPLFASMVRIDERLLQAARSLGASEWATFSRVFFPLTVPALAAGALLIFIMSLGFYVTPMILGGGRVPMLVNMLELLINACPTGTSLPPSRPAAGRDAGPVCAEPAADGPLGWMTAMPHAPSLSRRLVAVLAVATLLFIVLPVAIVVPMSFSSATTLEFPPPA